MLRSVKHTALWKAYLRTECADDPSVRDHIHRRRGKDVGDQRVGELDFARTPARFCRDRARGHVYHAHTGLGLGDDARDRQEVNGGAYLDACLFVCLCVCLCPGGGGGGCLRLVE